MVPVVVMGRASPSNIPLSPLFSSNSIHYNVFDREALLSSSSKLLPEQQHEMEGTGSKVKRAARFSPDSDDQYEMMDTRFSRDTFKSPDTLSSFQENTREEQVSFPEKIRFLPPSSPFRASRTDRYERLTPRRMNPDSDHDVNSFHPQGNLHPQGSLWRGRRRQTADEVVKEDNLREIMSGSKTGSASNTLNPFDYKRVKSKNSGDEERTYLWFGKIAWRYIKQILKIFWQAIDKEKLDRELIADVLHELTSNAKSSPDSTKDIKSNEYHFVSSKLEQKEKKKTDYR